MRAPTPMAAGAAIDALVQTAAPDLVPWLPLIADVIGAEVPMTEQVEALDETFHADRLRSAAVELIVALVGRGSVIVFEDVHWIDESSRALTEALIAGARRAADARADASPGRMVTDAGDHDRARRDRRRGGRATAAQRTAIERGQRRDAGAAAGNRPPATRSTSSNSHVQWRPRRRESDVHAYPETVERLLAARIDQLPVAGRELIRDAAVLGSTMSRSLASRVLDRPELIDADTWEHELGDLVAGRRRHGPVPPRSRQGRRVRGPVGATTSCRPSARRRRHRVLG